MHVLGVDTGRLGPMLSWTWKEPGSEPVLCMLVVVGRIHQVLVLVGCESQTGALAFPLSCHV